MRIAHFPQRRQFRECAWDWGAFRPERVSYICGAIRPPAAPPLSGNSTGGFSIRTAGNFQQFAQRVYRARPPRGVGDTRYYSGLFQLL